MSDSNTGPRSAGQGPLGDWKRVERFDPDALFGPGFVKGDDGRWTLALAGALYVNAEDEVELRTDGTTLVQEPGSPVTLKSPLQAAIIQEAKVRRADDSSLSARLTAALASKMATSYAVRFTESVTPSAGEGVEVVEAPSADAPTIRPFSNNGTVDIDLRLFGLGAGMVYVNGSIPLEQAHFTALGDLLVGTGAATLGTLAVGANGTVLTADSGEPTGVKWAVATSGSGNAYEAVVDFGTFDTTATTVVTGLAWVTATTKLVASVFGTEDALLDQVSATVTDRVDGVGFTVIAHAPNGSSGTHLVHVVGV